MITHTLYCPTCGSDSVIRHGRDAKGVQRYRCRACRYTFRADPQPQGYTPEQKAQILAAYRERVRGLTRIFGVSRTTVSAWLKQEAERLPPPGGDPSPGRAGRRPGTG